MSTSQGKKYDLVAVAAWSTDVMCGAVLREDIETEVRGRIAPHRVGMVGAVLGVAHSISSRGPCSRVVVRLARRRPSRPGEVDRIQGRFIVVALQRDTPAGARSR